MARRHTSDDGAPTAKQSKVVANNNGGASFEVSDLDRLTRFLILGCEGGSYYASERELGLENAACIIRLLESGEFKAVVDTILDVSVKGRAPKQQPTMFALALVLKHGSPAARLAGQEIIPKVCRIPTHLFTLLGLCKSMKVGWGRSFKRSIAEWYTEKPASKLAYLVTKYKQREGWSHKDAVRLAHPKTSDPEKDLVLTSMVKGIPEAIKAVPDGSDVKLSESFAFFSALEALNKLEKADVEQAIALVKQHKLAHEHIPAPFLSTVSMWPALLEHMPLTAMMRNLGRMSKLGVFEEVPAMIDLVCERLVDPDGLKAARIHPFNALVAQRTYNSGHGMRGSLSWTVEPRIASALEQAFYGSFGTVQSTGQRVMVALDVSGSMCCPINGTPVLTARDAAAAMSMVVLRTEPSVIVRGFCHTFVDLPITAEDSLEQVIHKTSRLPFGGTDCALPMVYATREALLVDTFIVYTDSETYSPHQSPVDALTEYRRKSGIDAKLIVVGMSSNGFSIADPSDRGMLDVVGFDTNAPGIMSEFMAGKL